MKINVLIATGAFALSMMLSPSANCEDTIYPADITRALELAGNNRPELEKAIEHYRTLDDSLKLSAAYFLVANMDGHAQVTFALQDTSKNKIDFDVLHYVNFDSLTANFAVMEQAHGVLDFGRDKITKDLETIKADYLIEQIDYAFRAWREKPWAAQITFADFCEYILPYRGSEEPLEPWRQYFWDKYSGLESGMTNPSDPIEASRLINDDIKKWFGFDPRFYYHPSDQGLQEMLANHLGRCEDMTNVTIYAMRANGIGVTSDYTPHWANSGNNHAWNAIVTPDGRAIPFMGAEANPGEYKLWNKLAKVYRKMYGKQSANLIFQPRKQEKVPGWLAGKSYIDVTRAYTPVADVDVTFKKNIPDSVDIAYLCVFNGGEWAPIHWGRIVDKTAKFIDMGTGIAYLPALYMNGEVVPFGSPFILQDDSTVTSLQKTHGKIKAKLTSTTNRKQDISTDTIEKSFLTPGAEYELFYWDNKGWQSLGKKTASDKPLEFKRVPKACLYWMVAKDSDLEERIFTINQSGQQVWW